MLKLNELVEQLLHFVSPVSCNRCQILAAIFLSKVPSLFTFVSCTRVSFYNSWILAALFVSKVLNFFCLVLYNSSWNCQSCFLKQFLGFSTLFLATFISSVSPGLCIRSWIFQPYPKLQTFLSFVSLVPCYSSWLCQSWPWIYQPCFCQQTLVFLFLATVLTFLSRYSCKYS